MPLNGGMEVGSGVALGTYIKILVIPFVEEFSFGNPASEFLESVDDGVCISGFESVCPPATECQIYKGIH